MFTTTLEIRGQPKAVKGLLQSCTEIYAKVTEKNTAKAEYLQSHKTGATKGESPVVKKR